MPRSDSSDRVMNSDSSRGRIVRQLAGGKPVDWETAAQGDAAPVLEGLKTIERLARLAQAERRAIAEMEQDPPPDGSRSPGKDAERSGSSDPIGAWGPLRLMEKIGAGSYGEVFRAHDPALQIDVALKLWSRQWSATPDLESFLVEARALARIRHPNVVTVLGAAEHDGRVGMWMELVRGETLEDSLEQRGCYGAGEAALIGADLCRALAAVHSGGLVHRDVKTRNVMRAEGGRNVLMDFGSVIPTQPLAGEDDRLLHGTPLSMAPEQLAGKPVGPRADLYGLGVLLYRLVSGRYPIEADSIDELIERHQRREHTPLRDRCADLPAEFVELVEWALAPDPSQRFASAGAFEQALLRFVQTNASRDPGAAVEPAAKRHNLHAPLTRFIGRERETVECLELLGHTRLLTLTGVAGCGKSRLGLRLAEEQLANPEGGVWFVDLAPVDDPSRVAQTLARTIGVREERGRRILESIASHIGTERTCIVVDNCEHVVAAVAETTMALLGDCPNLRMIVTSREALGVPGEAVFAVPSLSLPAAGARTVEAVDASEAVRLFVDGAVLAQPGFRLADDNAATLAEICRRLEGIPFAIELAAARVNMLTPEEILIRLDDRFRLLTGKRSWALPRHRTLLETLAWSYDLLTVEEQALLRCLAVFAGGWTLESAQRVCSTTDDPYQILESLTRLVDKSLVMVERSARAGSRYRMLETVRQFALEKWIDAAEQERIRNRHRDHFAAVIAKHALELQSGGELRAALDACDAEHENVLAALGWCEKCADDDGKALAIVGSFFPYWTNRALFSLGLAQVVKALARPGAETITLDRAKATFAAAVLSFYLGDSAMTRAHGEASLAHFRRLGYKRGMVWSLNAVANARVLDLDATRALYQESLSIAREIGYSTGLAIALNNLADLALEAGDPAAALPLFRESVEINRQQGRAVSLGLSLGNLAETLVRLGDFAAARAPLIESLRIARETRRQDYGEHSVSVTGLTALGLEAWSVAARLLGSAAALREITGVPLQAAEQKSLESATVRLRGALGDSQFEAAWEQGRGLSFDDAIDRAIEWLSVEPDDGRA